MQIVLSRSACPQSSQNKVAGVQISPGESSPTDMQTAALAMTGALDAASGDGLGNCERDVEFPGPIWGGVHISISFTDDN